MELVWNLDELFKNINECYKAFEKIDEMISELKKYKSQTLNKELLKELLDKSFECLDLSYRCLVYGSLRYYENIKDEECVQLKKDVEHKNAEVEAELSFIRDMIANSEKECLAFLDENADLEPYRYYIEEIFRKKKHVPNSEQATAIKKELMDLANEYDKIVKGITFESITIEDEVIELTPANIAKYVMSRDKETRKLAYLSLNHGYQAVEDDIASIINRIFHKRKALAKLGNHDSILDFALFEEDIPRSIVTELIKVVTSKKPLLQKFMGLKAKILGLESPHLYDLGIPLDFNTKRKYPLEESIDIIKSAFATLGTRYVDTALSLIRENHIDALPREEKHPSMTFSWYGYSFLNYKNSYNDVKNLVHELGHSINDMLSRHLPYPYKISSVFIGETASIVNEILLNRYLLSSALGKEERLFYLNKEIDNYITSVYRQVMYTEIEIELCKRVEEGGEITADFLNSTYGRILKSYYGDNIIYDEEASHEWTRMSHIIRWSFYQYKYATGLLIASTVHKNLLSQELPYEDYLQFLSSGSNKNSIDLMKLLGINLDNLGILSEGFTLFESDIEELDKEFTTTPDLIVKPHNDN